MSIPALRRLARGLFLVSLLLVAGIGLYAAFGAWVVPRIVQAKLQAYVEDQLHRQLRLGSVRCDPFAFTIELRDVAILERGRELVGFRRLFVDYEATSFFSSTHRLRQVDLEKPYARAVIRRDGSLNLAELVPRFKMPTARLEDVHVSDGKVDVTDLYGHAQFSTTLAPITVRIRDFQTTRESGDFRLALRTRDGERLVWWGDLGLKPFASRGNIALAGLQARTVQGVVGAWLPFVLADGRTDLTGRYVLADRSGEPRVDATLTRLVATGLRLRMGRSDVDWTLPSTTFDGVRLSLGRPSRATVDRIVATDMRRQTQADGSNWTVPKATFEGVWLSLDRTGATTVSRIATTGLRRRAPEGVADWVLPKATFGGIRMSLGRSGTATVSRILATQLRLHARREDTDWLDVPTATLEDAQLDPDRHEIAIRSLRLTGLDARLRRERNGALNLHYLFARVAVASTGNAGARAWALRLGVVDVREAALHLEDRTVQPAATLDLAPLSAHLTDVRPDSSGAFPMTVDAIVNGHASLHVRGDVLPGALAADLHVELDALPLSVVVPYVPPHPFLQLPSGDVTANGRVAIRLKGAAGPALRYDGDASVARFRLATSTDRNLLSWERVDLQGIALRAVPLAIDVHRVIAHQPFVHVVLEPNLRLNLAADFAPAPAGTQRHVVQGFDASRLPPVRVDEIVFVDGALAFADQWIHPNFRARIEALHGRVADVSTQPDSIARLDLSGQVINRHSPVTIRGHMNLLRYDDRTDVYMSFRNIELPIFNPYSGYFAGYAIDKGKLSTDLHYRIDNRQLVADHHLVVSQLEWGEATHSEHKVSLPIRMATSLLKDSHGVITLDLPVTGSLDDPAFRLGPVVGQIMQNVLGRVASAPFRWLGHLFKGAEKAHYVDFAPGSAELSAGARNDLSDLAASLKDRPELRIDIPAGPLPDADVEALEDQRLQAAITPLRQGRHDAGTPYADLGDAEKIQLLEGLYVQEFGQRPDVPAGALASQPALAAAGEGNAGQPPGSAVAADLQAVPAGPPPPAKPTQRQDKASTRHAQVAWLEEQLRPRFQAPPGAEQALAHARAVAVQEALLADGVLDPSRVFLEGDVSPVAEEGVVRMELAVK